MTYLKHRRQRQLWKQTAPQRMRRAEVEWVIVTTFRRNGELAMVLLAPIKARVELVGQNLRIRVL